MHAFQLNILDITSFLVTYYSHVTLQEFEHVINTYQQNHKQHEDLVQSVGYAALLSNNTTMCRQIAVNGCWCDGSL
jgi:hypothetical protein